jgi:hypothetical protein
MFAAIVCVTVVGLSAAREGWGTALFAGALVALGAWRFERDLARRTVRSHGLTRFIAACLLSGYAWLALGGVIVAGAPANDAALHALALGFLFSMVLGHAPLILPAMLKVAVPYHASLCAPLALLHTSLALQVAGDAMACLDWTRIGAPVNALALAAFIINVVVAVQRGRPRQARMTDTLQ